jgi:capsular polysaccharide biosynthesis protein
MTAPLKIMGIEEIEPDEAILPRGYYEEIARDTLGTLWRQKQLIVGIPLVALSVAFIALLLVGPHYSSEAMIQLNFIREEPANNTKIQSTAVVDAVALVDSATRAIRSRATAGAVVDRLGLDKDPDFARESTLWRVLLGVRATPRDLAVNRLMRKVRVTNEPRSYLISIAVATNDPEQAAMLANAVALEYLRGQMLQQTSEIQTAAERELNQLSSVYGVHHPNYILARARLETLQSHLTALRSGPSDADTVRHVIGQSFIAAEKSSLPSGPSIILVLGLTAGAALSLGIWLTLWLARRRRPGVDASIARKPIATTQIMS